MAESALLPLAGLPEPEPLSAEGDLAELDEPFLEEDLEAEERKGEGKRKRKKAPGSTRPRTNSIEGALAGIGGSDHPRSAAPADHAEVGARAASLVGQGGVVGGITLLAPLLSGAEHAWANPALAEEGEGTQPFLHQAWSGGLAAVHVFGSGGLATRALDLPPAGPSLAAPEIPGATAALHAAQPLAETVMSGHLAMAFPDLWIAPSVQPAPPAPTGSGAASAPPAVQADRQDAPPDAGAGRAEMPESARMEARPAGREVVPEIAHAAVPSAAAPAPSPASAGDGGLSAAKAPLLAVLAPLLTETLPARQAQGALPDTVSTAVSSRPAAEVTEDRAQPSQDGSERDPVKEAEPLAARTDPEPEHKHDEAQASRQEVAEDRAPEGVPAADKVASAGKSEAAASGNAFVSVDAGGQESAKGQASSAAGGNPADKAGQGAAATQILPATGHDAPATGAKAAPVDVVPAVLNGSPVAGHEAASASPAAEAGSGHSNSPILAPAEEVHAGSPTADVAPLATPGGKPAAGSLPVVASAAASVPDELPAVAHVPGPADQTAKADPLSSHIPASPVTPVLEVPLVVGHEPTLPVTVPASNPAPVTAAPLPGAPHEAEHVLPAAGPGSSSPAVPPPIAEVEPAQAKPAGPPAGPTAAPEALPDVAHGPGTGGPGAFGQAGPSHIPELVDQVAGATGKPLPSVIPHPVTEVSLVPDHSPPAADPDAKAGGPASLPPVVPVTLPTADHGPGHSGQADPGLVVSIHDPGMMTAPEASAGGPGKAAVQAVAAIQPHGPDILPDHPEAGHVDAPLVLATVEPVPAHDPLVSVHDAATPDAAAVPGLDWHL